MARADRTLRLGIIGLGQAAAMILDEIKAIPGLPWRVTAAADPREHARAAFEAEYGGNAYAAADDLCRLAEVDAVYITSPSWMHLEHTLSAARTGRHIICEKPLALSLADCKQMVEAARQAGVILLAGHTHSFDAPVVKLAELVASGAYGGLRTINAWNYNEFNHRPRLISELEATHGPVLNQGPHHVDIIRQIGGGLVRSVRATTIPDCVTGVEGGYVCYLQFENGVPATMVYDGRGLFDTAELFGWVGEGGDKRDPAVNHRNRAEFSRVMGLPQAERDRFLDSGKEAGRYGADKRRVLHNAHKGEAPNQPFFGLIVASCDHAALRQSSDGLYLYGKNGREELPVARSLGGRAAELQELSDSILHGVKPFHDGAWGLATLEVCFAILESARTVKEIEMSLQVAC